MSFARRGRQIDETRGTIRRAGLSWLDRVASLSPTGPERSVACLALMARAVAVPLPRGAGGAARLEESRAMARPLPESERGAAREAARRAGVAVIDPVPDRWVRRGLRAEGGPGADPGRGDAARAVAPRGDPLHFRRHGPTEEGRADAPRPGERGAGLHRLVRDHGRGSDARRPVLRPSARSEGIGDRAGRLRGERHRRERLRPGPLRGADPGPPADGVQRRPGQPSIRAGGGVAEPGGASAPRPSGSRAPFRRRCLRRCSRRWSGRSTRPCRRPAG